MPRTKREAVPRKTIRIPESIVDEVDRIVRDSGLYFNRQQFIESAVRDKVERFRFAEDRRSREPDVERVITSLPHRVDEGFLVRIKETFLAHAIINSVKEKKMPSDHLDSRQLEENIRQYIKNKAERDGRGITKEYLDGLTEELLKYHKELLEGLSLMEPY